MGHNGRQRAQMEHNCNSRPRPWRGAHVGLEQMLKHYQVPTAGYRQKLGCALNDAQDAACNRIHSEHALAWLDAAQHGGAQ